MKYENGRDMFPERLLKQIQKYASGKLVYIPSADKKKDWGETTGYRKYLLKLYAIKAKMICIMRVSLKSGMTEEIPSLSIW